MNFGPVPTDQASGAILAHSVALPKGRLRKGVTLTADHIARLTAAGIAEITVARLDPGDIHEDSAATRLARAILGPTPQGLHATPAATGRVNLIADTPGIARINAAAIHAINAIRPEITIATVPEWHRMDPGGLVATIKIISYAVPDAALTQACTGAASAISLAPPVLTTAALIQTTVPVDDGARGHEALQSRLDRLGTSLAPKRIVAHDEAAIADALLSTHADVIFVLTGSATSDRHDTAPNALRRAGGQVHHYGMPVDPGNLLFLGDLTGTPVIGLPGCARSPALNGADWVLERVICGVPVTPRDIAQMGVGGLLKEIPTRPAPRRGRPRAP